MQKGFVTFEIILVTFAFALLMSVAIPNAERIIDRVALDYETKKLYTEMRFLQSFDRMAFMEDTHFKTNADSMINLIIYPERYLLRKNSDRTKIYAEHYFSHGVNISKNNKGKNWNIRFDDMGKHKTPGEKGDWVTLDEHLYINSKLRKRTSIVFDTVGRFKGERNDDQTK